MSEIHYIWPGSNSNYLMSSLNDFIKTYYPTTDNSFQIARNLEEDIRQILSQNGGILEIENQLNYIGSLSNFVINILIRSHDEELFPGLAMLSYGLEYPTDEAVDGLLDIIKSTLEHHLRTSLQADIVETWDQRTYILGVAQTTPIMQNFEKNQLGIFLYLLYLKHRFDNNPKVCVIIPELDPLIKQVHIIEEDLGSLTKEEFLGKHPKYYDEYDNILDSYKHEQLSIYRFMGLFLILSKSGPYIKNVITTETQNITVLLGIHSNILIIDHINKIIERYELNGHQSTFDSEEDDNQLYLLAKTLGYQVQLTGSTGITSILYVIERIETNLPREEVVNNFMDIIIERYNLIEDGTIEEKAIALEKWINETIHNIFEEMDDIYAQLSNALGLKIKYEHGRLVYLS